MQDHGKIAAKTHIQQYAGSWKDCCIKTQTKHYYAGSWKNCWGKPTSSTMWDHGKIAA
jgi:hypothetical protein